MSDMFEKRMFARVLSFATHLWMRRIWLVIAILALVLLSTAADVAIPVYTGRLITAVGEEAAPWPALFALLKLGAFSIATKVISYFAIIALTIPTMQAAEAEAFAHVQRLPTDWQANACAAGYDWHAAHFSICDWCDRRRRRGDLYGGLLHAHAVLGCPGGSPFQCTGQPCVGCVGGCDHRKHSGAHPRG